jgi:hypothetical protein
MLIKAMGSSYFRPNRHRGVTVQACHSALIHQEMCLALIDMQNGK